MGDGADARGSETLSPDDRRFLLGVARAAVEAAIRGADAALPGIEAGSPSPSAPGRRFGTGGVFVSLQHRNGDLRGCVGLLRSECSLEQGVARMAVAAATRDGRFAPVTAIELAELVIEISALGPLRRVRPEEVEAGRHGLHLRVSGCSGVLLPQVAIENGWDREEFLRKTAGKAGLPEDAWQRAEAEISVFTAEVFGEE
jgi:AmmeMemoRadiSam system protein A